MERMKELSPVLARILQRYVAGALIYKGLVDTETGNFLATDPDIANLIEFGLGASIGLVAEGWYALARWRGWAK